MTGIIVIVMWILATLLISSFSVVLGKRYGVEYAIAILASLIVIANVLANKIVVFGPFTVPAGVLVFSSTFLITDILSEKWDKRTARKAVWAGFYAQIVLAISVLIAVAWEPAPFAAEISLMFAKVLELSPRIAVASILAYLVSQHHDVWAFHFWKRKTRDRHLWLRNNASTAVSQLLDSLIFVTVAFYGVFDIIPLLIGQYFVKLIIAIMDTPFMYGIAKLVDKVNEKKYVS